MGIKITSCNERNWCLEGTLERMNRFCLPYVPGQCIQREGAICLKARWPYRFVLQSLGRGTSKTDSLADRRERDGVYVVYVKNSRMTGNPLPLAPKDWIAHGY